MSTGTGDGSRGMPRVEGFPRTMARIVASVVAIGVLPLTLVQPIVAIGVLSGGTIAAAGRWVSRSVRGALLTAFLLPVGVSGALVTLFLAADSDPATLAPAAPGVLFGAAFVATLTQGVSAPEVREKGDIAVTAGAVTGCGALVASGLWWIGSLTDAVGWLLWATGHQPFAVLGSLLVSLLTLVLGIFLLPAQLYTSPRRTTTTDVIRRKARIVVGIAGVIPVAVVFLVVLASLANQTPLFESFYATVTDPLPRAAAVVLTTVGGVLVVLSALAWRSWRRPTGAGRPVVPATCGAAIGVGIVLTLAFVAGFPTTQGGTVPALLWVSTFVLVVGGYLLGGSGEFIEEQRTVSGAFVLAVTLLVTAVATEAATWGETRTFDTQGLATLFALAAGILAYAGSRYGRELGRDIGPDVSRRPQLVWLGWHGGIAVVALVVAIGLLWLATVLTPAVAVPATLALGIGFLAILGVTVLLLR